MAKKGEHRLKLALFCSVCKSQNYNTSRNKINTKDKLQLKKYCKRCKKHQIHKETDKLD